MLTKETVLKMVAAMPDTFTLDDVVDRLVLMDKISKGEAQVQDGNVYTTDKAKAKLKHWLGEKG